LALKIAEEKIEVEGKREKSVFVPIPKKGKAKECSDYHTIEIISHVSKVMLKIHQARVH